MHSQTSKDSGFTLMEMLIVIAIIAVLVAIAIPVLSAQLGNSKRAVDEANARSAYAVALVQYMDDEESGTVSYVYDVRGGSAAVASSGSSVEGYGQWDQPADYEVGGVAVTGVANDGTARAVVVTVADGVATSIRWGGNDLSTAAGRRQEDINNMHAIASALRRAYEADDLVFQKNYVQVAVFGDGTMAYFNDRWSGESNDQTIKDALTSAGLSTETSQIYSDDAKWKYGYVVHFDKNGEVFYKAISEKENESHEVAWNWWNKQNITDEDLAG